MEMIFFVLSIFSISLVVSTVVRDRKEYIEWEKSLIQKREKN